MTIRELIRARWGRAAGDGSLAAASSSRSWSSSSTRIKNLSVQVHPDDEMGRRDWPVTTARRRDLGHPGRRARKCDLCRPEARCRPGRVCRRDPGGRGSSTFAPPFRAPDPGDCILIESGTVHAWIGAGASCWPRFRCKCPMRRSGFTTTGTRGRRRQAPPVATSAEAMEVDRFRARAGEPDQACGRTDYWRRRLGEKLSRSAYFALERLTLHLVATAVGQHDRFTILMGLEGSAGRTSATVANTSGSSSGQTVLSPPRWGPVEIVMLNQGREDPYVRGPVTRYCRSRDAAPPCRDSGCRSHRS